MFFFVCSACLFYIHFSIFIIENISNEIEPLDIISIRVYRKTINLIKIKKQENRCIYV